ncbi:2-dehydro-3-deoxygalactonokinase [Ancylobacter sp. WKF20]|uniref:2-dehydro-3-deoxygalactonokinase n=1 Tax=Ancylobacter sp. WKF20 TaxID=3039801 RepID=UPI0024343690|nr:2-dehydro-3-deoxygalactonokinase [Ancylobacter sp. WKF20]WGD29566.1 2-dehydro-3-deoxygalactonokinase [Ancylobacter sp. WKF20]
MAVSHVVVDWGTSSFRLWALDHAGRVLGERRSAQGLTVTTTEGFEAVLEDHLAALGIPDGVPVMMCGMVGSRTGWIEAAYIDTPAPLDGLAARAIHVPSRRRLIRILPGVAQRDTAHPDVMRGEETQCLALAVEGFSGLACLPGTHSKWVALKDGVLTSFATFMTGELFQLLRTGSVITHAVDGAGAVAPGAAFGEGVEAAFAAPETATNLWFELRARWLLAGAKPDATLARLSGLLIGLELAGATRRLGALNGAVLIASGPIADLYAQALALAGAGSVSRRDAEACVREGLHAAALNAFHPEGATS